ncbi:hypothetical protein N0V94_009283 [Neodidymelliopsis sp. IMI 364377]|nr:hypothetical protein N0V94_009283 [Neodidymelliopsis sp. IMI 364377]
MAPRLSSWLHEEFATQLGLGNCWLDDKNRLKAKAVQPSPTLDRKWDRLYHDNGSCLEIFGPLTADHICLLVTQTSPLILTDGQHHVAASLTTTCLHDLRARFPPHDLVTGTLLRIRKYTIRYTSYGPPPHKLQFILDNLDWVGTHPGLIVDIGPLHPLHHAEEIGSALRQLHYTRAREDHRCLRPQLKEEEDTDNGVCTMAGPDETFDENLSMNTQLPFATQVQRPVKRRTNDDDVQFIGAKPLEPILAGNTRRAELKRESHTSAQEDQQKAKLLSLLNTTPTRLDKGKKRMQEADVDSTATEPSAKKTSSSKKESKQHNGSGIEKFAAECSWMKGLKLNHDTSTVPQEQVNILAKPESWHKPLPGLRFPEANIPMQIFMTLSRLEDERVAALEVSSGSYVDTDPSPASHPTTSAPQVEDEQEDEQEDESDDEPATSLVSWTPSPEPPQRPTSPRRGLPPDSSIEVPEDTTETAVSHKPTVAVSHSPPPTLPASSNEDEYHKR